jgi:DNA-binding response OmpR family regulator
MKILLAENDELLLHMMAHRLRLIAGAEVATATNGKLARQIADSMQPDVVLTELIMPLVSGLELISHLRSELNAEPYIIAVSSIDKIYALPQALSVGADCFMPKPLDLDELIGYMNARGLLAEAS